MTMRCVTAISFSGAILSFSAFAASRCIKRRSWRTPLKLRYVLVLVALLGGGVEVAYADPSTQRNVAVAGFSGGAGLVVGASAATGIGIPIAGAIGAATGSFQIGWFAMSFLFASADVPNALNPVNINDFLVSRFPDLLSVEPTLDAGVASAFDDAFDNLDVAIASNRAYQASIERQQGALILGDTGAAAARQSEADSFAAQRLAAVQQTRASIDTVVAALDTFNPLILDLVVPASEIISTRDQISSGSFPVFESLAISAWDITPEELFGMSDAFSNLTAEQIGSYLLTINPAGGDNATLRQVFIEGSDIIVDSQIPEPPTTALLALGLAGIFFSRRKRTH